MVHTATLSFGTLKNESDFKVKSHQFRQYISLSSTKGISNSTFVNLSLINYGIIIVGLIRKNQDYTWYQYLIKINFQRLIEQDNHILLFSEASIAEVAEQFDYQLSSLNIGMPSFYDWKCTRIDYCVNINTPFVKAYINLLKKCNKAHYHSLSKGNRKQIYISSSSVYLYGESTNINIYDKQAQLIDEKSRNITRFGEEKTNQMILDAQNILRIEVQCKKNRTDYILKKIKQENPDITAEKFIAQFLSDDLAENELFIRLGQISPDKSFHTKKTVIESVKKLKIRIGRQERILKLLEEINKKYYSVWRVKEISEKKAEITRDLKVLPYNPVWISEYMLKSEEYIPQEYRKEVRKHGLPPLQQLIKHAVREEKELSEQRSKQYMEEMIASWRDEELYSNLDTAV